MELPADSYSDSLPVDKDAAGGRAQLLEPADRNPAGVIGYTGRKQEFTQVSCGAERDLAADLWQVSPLHCT
jgi:hypothetical protein